MIQKVTLPELNYSLMPYTCPKCDRALTRPNAWHQCARIPLDKLFLNKTSQVRSLFDLLIKEIDSWKNVHYSTTSHCIVFICCKTFMVVKPMKTALDLKFYLNEIKDEFPVYKTSTWGKRTEHYIRLFDTNDLDHVVWNFLKQSYEEDLAGIN